MQCFVQMPRIGQGSGPGKELFSLHFLIVSHIYAMHYGYIHPLLLLPPVIPSSSLNPFFLTNFPPSAISSQQLFRERRDLVDTSSIRDGTLKGCVHRGCVFMVAWVMWYLDGSVLCLSSPSSGSQILSALWVVISTLLTSASHWLLLVWIRFCS